MINYGFPAQPTWKGNKLFSFEGHTPSLVTGSTMAFQTIVNAFLEVLACSASQFGWYFIIAMPTLST